MRPVVRVREPGDRARGGAMNARVAKFLRKCARSATVKGERKVYAQFKRLWNDTPWREKPARRAELTSFSGVSRT